MKFSLNYISYKVISALALSTEDPQLKHFNIKSLKEEYWNFKIAINNILYKKSIVYILYFFICKLKKWMGCTEFEKNNNNNNAEPLNTQ